MAVDWLDLIIKIGVPILSLIGGWAGAAFRLAGRISTIEHTIDHHANAIHAQLAATQKQELSDLRAHLQERIGQYGRDLTRLEDIVDRHRASATDFAKDAELASFIEEQNSRWLEINRTLGLIEGALQRLPMGSMIPRPNPLRK